jgi:HK97 family phage prohead protease
VSEPVYKIFADAILKRDASLNDREIRVVASDRTVDRIGDVMEPGGCKLDNFRNNPIVLANHDPDQPLGTAEAEIKSDRLEALITFAPPGLSKMADEWCGLCKAGILGAMSVGFSPIEFERIKEGGLRYTKWELLELSVVSVPANPNAIIVARDARRAAHQQSATRGSITAIDDVFDALKPPRWDCGKSPSENLHIRRLWEQKRDRRLATRGLY